MTHKPASVDTGGSNGQPDEDGALRPALNALEDAIAALTEPRQATINGERVIGASPYMQLWDAVSGESSNGGGSGGGSKSQIPMWTDAFVLLDEIDTALACWQPAFDGTPPTVGRLKWIAAQSYRPQDVRKLSQITDAVTDWTARIGELLNPKPRWTLPYPCPRCDVKTVYRRDSTGEKVRSPTLQLSAEGCDCASCRAHWAPGEFLFLGKLLGGSAPAGVIE